MKKTSLLLMLLLAFCAPWAVQAQTFTVCNGTDESDRLPVYGYYADSYQKSEFVIPGTMMSQLNGTTLTGLTFYLSESSNAVWTGTFQVFLKEVQGTTYNNFQGPGYSGGSAATTVYTGSLDATGSTMNITFSEGFIYHGGNLLIGIYETAIDGSWGNAYFYGVETSGAGLNEVGTSLEEITATMFSVMNFLPKTTFTYSNEVQTYTVSAIIDPANAGTVSGTGEYEPGEGCNLIATPNEGYSFDHWSYNGVYYSSNPNIGFNVNQDLTFTAHFTDAPMPTYTVTVSANPTNGGTVTGGGPYEQGSFCTVTAQPNPGYVFVRWTENGITVSDFLEHTFQVFGDRNLVAQFEVEVIPPHTITVSANPAEGGTVTGGGTFEHGTTCTVSAQANAGYTFTKWTEYGSIVSTEPTYSFEVLSDRTLVAHFTPEQLPTFDITVSANPTNGGTVSGGGTYEQGSTCIVHAQAMGDYTFEKWTENDIVVSTEVDYAFMVMADRDLVAIFTSTAVPTYTISVSANPANGGTVTGGGTFDQGESCTVTAQANEGYTFNGWTENGSVVSNSASYTFMVTGDRILVANFISSALPTYNIVVSANPANGGTVSGGGVYEQGATCTVSVQANNGFSFDYWTENGNVVSSNVNYTFTVTSNRTLVAQFTANPTPTYNITVSANPTDGGTVSGGGIYEEGVTCTVNAMAKVGYTFVNWTENGNVVSTHANYSFVVTSNHNLVANFQYTEGLDEQTALEVAIYPSPVSNVLTVEASEAIDNIEIFSLTGAMVYSQKNCTEKVEINAADFAPGTYIIRMTTQNASEIRRFVKQ